MKEKSKIPHIVTTTLLFFTILFIDFPIDLYAQIEDITPPALDSFSFTPTTIDISTQDQTVTITLQITDDLSGFRAGAVWFLSPSGNQSVNTGSIEFQNLIFGDELNGTYQASITIPRFSETGIWRVSPLHLGDFANNHVDLQTSELAALGFPTELEVTGTPDITPPALDSFSFTPTTIDISTQDQTVTITLQITDDLSGFRAGAVWFLSPSGNQSVNTGSIEFQNLIFGDELNGTYQASITIPRFSETGIWRVSPLHLGDFANNHVDLQTSELAALGFPTELEVTGTPDITPPALDSFSFTPTTIDISTQDQTVTITLQITDDLSGFRAGAVWFLSPSGNQSVNTGSIEFQNLIFGDELNGTYQASITIPRFSETGIWRVSPLHLGDFANNHVDLQTSELAALGFPTELEVVSSTEDLTGPEIFNFTFSPSTIDISTSPQTFTSTMRITDDNSGFNWGRVSFRSPTSVQSAAGNFVRISGDELDGMYEASVTIPLFSEAGIWRVSQLIAGDNTGNNTSFNESELIALGFPTELEVVSSTEDLTGPEIFNFTFSPSTIDISTSPQTFTSTMRITDDNSGFNWGRVSFRSPTSVQSAAGNFVRISGDELDGMYEASVTIPLFSEAGIWRVSQLIAGDNTGNNTSFNESELIALGFPTELEVVSSTEDLTGPEIFNFTFSPSTIDISTSPQTFTSTMRITDDNSGFNWGRVSFRSPTSVQSAAGNFVRISGDELDGMYEASVTIPLFSEAGIWRVSQLIAGDNTGNNTSFNESELIALGFPTELEVVSVSDTDGDGIPDDQDVCPNEDATGFDTDNDGCIDNLTGLNDMLETLVEQGVIEVELKNSLLSKVANAEKSADKENIDAAIHKLEALINEINAQRGKKISEYAAEGIILYTESIINWLLNQLV